MSVLVAVFNQTTGWSGKTITYEEAERQFILEDHGPVTAHDVLGYDEQCQLEWAQGGLREWVRDLADREDTRRMNAETLAAMDTLGCEWWEWSTANDDKVCEPCAARDGRRFRRGDSMPPLHEGCRCGSAAVPPGMEDAAEQEQATALSAKEAKKLERQQQAHAKALAVKFKDAEYLGGLLDQRKKRSGDLSFTPTEISLRPVLIPMGDVASIRVGGGQVAKNRVKATLAFGVIGGLAARGTKDRADLTVVTRSGSEAYFQIPKRSELDVRAALSPLLRELGIPFSDDLPQSEAAAQANGGPVVVSAADELAKLAQLHGQGVLTDEEFAAQKAKLLG